MSNRNDSPHEPLKTVVPFTTTIDVRDRCLCLHTQRAARAIARRFDDAFRPLNLTGGQFSILMSLNRPAPPTLGQVAQLLGLDRTTLTANLKPLERRGLVIVSADPQDKRSRRPRLTEEGLKLLVRAVPLWEETQAALEKALGIAGEADRLRGDLNVFA
ncbi:MarR family transcriptional regulator [Jiella endophytica]|uniref:MarR family transcriptional regulator n=1 Tax=Jiella endophytica TaxID=2558362 RepID=A0A4Y8RB65_9HYPH|nr:MarR family transcriptional regulator [Jiella endophytica]TFF18353.1 MarR family transcriptional regulator [Jiella endophytica]